MPSRPPSFPISDHCDGRRFFNPGLHVNRSWLDVLRWKTTSRPTPWPVAVEAAPQALSPAPQAEGVTVTWINHASFLLQSRSAAILIDPVWSERAGPFGLLGPKRVHPPGLRFGDLPPIDAVLLSHDHYDHCDLTTLRQLARQRSRPVLIAPLGHESLARRAGFAREYIVTLDWWETFALKDSVQVRLTPARHWSNRLHGLRNRRLWGGYRLDLGARAVQFTGDTGFDESMFREVRARCGAPDLAAIPIGAYEPRWFMAAQHCNPAEAVRIHQDLGARRSVAMHWGTFPLTDEGRMDPVEALQEALREAHLSPSAFEVLAPGGSLLV